jgi:phosphatidylinositol 4-phosphatase
MSQQKGVFRVNCIDCLDRTNVVQVSPFAAVCDHTSNNTSSCTPQSAFARFVLQGQLEAVALPSSSEAGDRTDADVIFNDGQQ